MVTHEVHRASLRTGLFFLSVSSSLILVGCAPAAPSADASYIAVIDAGSSGSRIHLYQESEKVIEEVALEQDEVDVPLASFESTPSAAGPEVIAPLLAPLEAFAEESGVVTEDITVNVMGTAGMRKVDAPQADQIYASAADTITAAGFTAGITETISGDDEALFAWADANDLNGSLGDPAAEPIGIVEVGGASAQVAFALSDASTAPAANVREVTINEVTYPVFAYSYLGLGQNDARTAMLENTDARVACYPNSTDSAETVQASDAIEFPANEALFDFGTCSLLYDAVIAETAQAFPLEQVTTLPGFVDTQFYGLSSISFAVADFKVNPGDVAAALETTVEAECSGADASAQIEALFPEDAQAFAEQACANGTYIATLLEELSIPSANLIAESEINSASPAWARGFAVLEAWGQVSPPAAEVSSTVLLDKATQTVLGETLAYPQDGQAEVTSALITLPPGAQTGLHYHEAPLLAYVLSGVLTVEYANGETKTFAAGTAVVESIGTVHNGMNRGTTPVELIAFNIGSSTVTNTIPVAP